MTTKLNKHKLGDVSETLIREHMPEVLDILLIDRTKSNTKKNQNIIWANDNYIQFGARAYAPEAPIRPELVTGIMDSIIMPRALKPSELQKERTRTKAEVFTPTWVVKKQNDAVDENYASDDLETYTNRTWLEITCGEAPYMVSRYDMDTGDEILLPNRVGFVDRKLRRLNAEVDDRATWQSLVETAYKASYGFEWSGDSLLLARENLLYTYRDYFMVKWGVEPDTEQLKTVAEIISYNVFQMDGLRYIVPFSDTRVRVAHQRISLFDDPEDIQEEWITKPGKRVKVMNWDKNKMEFFDKGVA
ncbi:restriction endonuclease [Lacticaseibacillus paracasei]|uniref:restriction endonuclease n=1 Tax=Lacticaseibacillus paracasei TaxID=1597 RepID=UPI000F0B0ED1|nr:restriction endonuclease [Lacticaseibacillus paracasei]RND55558.1 hypothetical protein FAM18121_00532 [Lacticaseibacillus paracasei]